MAEYLYRQIDPQKLKNARIKAGFQSPTEVAKTLQISPKTLLNYESGFARPQPHILDALLLLYGIADLTDLFTPVSNPNQFSPRKNHI